MTEKEYKTNIKPDFKEVLAPVPFCPICGLRLEDVEACGDWHYSCSCGQWWIQEDGTYTIT